MSALGDYVHLNTANYLKYGIAKKGETPKTFKAPTNFIKNRVIDVKPISKETISLLESRLKRNTPAAIEKDKTFANEDFQNKINKIYELLATQADAAVLGRFEGYAKNTGNWQYTGDYQQLKGKALPKGEVKKRQVQFDEINKKINELNKKGIVDSKEVEDLVHQYENIVGKRIDTVGPPNSILGMLQEEIQNTAYYSWISNLTGDFGEHLVALCDDAIESNVDGALDNIEKLISGRERSSITISKDSIAKDLSGNRSFSRTDEYGNYYLGSSQDKVDVKMTVNTENVLANVKMYTDASQVTLQSQTNLFTALVYLNMLDDFGTHWLNMHAGTDARKKRNEEADEILKQEIAFEALVSGNPLKKDISNANVFVFMDRKTGKVFIKSTKDLLLNELYRFKIAPEIKGIQLQNIYDPDSAQDRIAQLLIEAHQISFHVKMDVQ